MMDYLTIPKRLVSLSSIRRLLAFLLHIFRKRKLELILIAPLFLYVFGVTLAPIFGSIYMSFEQRGGGGFPTLASYRRVVTSYEFVDSLFNTFFFTILSVSGEIIIGLGIAMIMAKRFRGRGIFRTIMILPLGMPVIVAAANMRYIFARSGYLNELLYRLGIYNLIKPIDWLSTTDVLINIPHVWTVTPAFFALVISDMWKVTPLVMLILLAGLESIPRELYEAAEVDGSSWWQRFKYITLPLLKPSITMAIVIRGVDAFRVFIQLRGLAIDEHVKVLSFYAYNRYVATDYQASGAASTILLLMILLAIVSYIMITGRREVTR